MVSPPLPSLEAREARLVDMRANQFPSIELVDALNDLAESLEDEMQRKIELSSEAYELARALRYPRGQLQSIWRATST